METKTPEEVAHEIGDGLADILRDVLRQISDKAFRAGYEAAEKRMGKLISDHDSRWKAGEVDHD